jgi:DNA modification methylase
LEPAIRQGWLVFTLTKKGKYMTININEIKKGKLIEGDSIKELKRIPSDSIDQVITDPPYGLKYHTFQWDKQQATIDIWKDVLRVLKPGAFAFVMSAARQDLLLNQTMVLQKAGFFIGFSSLYWIYKTGTQHGKNMEKAMSDQPNSKDYKNSFAGFQPKPATEVILVAMKPLYKKDYTEQAMDNGKGITFVGNCKTTFLNKKNELETRNMSNIVVSDKALDFFDEDSGNIECEDYEGNSFRFSLDLWAKYTFPYFIVPKASKKEKDFGLMRLPYQKVEYRKKGLKSYNTSLVPRPSYKKNIHPTVKPIKLMLYLVLLGSRKNEIVLDPFCGSGTTCLSAMFLERKFIGIEQDPKSIEIAKERLCSIKRVPEKKPSKASKLSEVKYIELKFKDQSVFDMESLPAAIDYALQNPEKNTVYENCEITSNYKSNKDHIWN